MPYEIQGISSLIQFNVWWLNGASRGLCGEHYLAAFKLITWGKIHNFRTPWLHFNNIHRENILMHILKSKIMKGNIMKRYHTLKRTSSFFPFKCLKRFPVGLTVNAEPLFCSVDLFLLFTVGSCLNSSYMLFAFYTTCHNLYWL